MATKRKLQVFVSSTYTDMLSERQAAVEAILRAGHIPAGMEIFAAGNEPQLETIRRWIDDSDIFMLILGGRYGSIEPNSGKSYIEMEYDYAAGKKKPLFAAVVSEYYLDAKVKSAGLDATERINGHLLQSFREKVASKICRFFGDVNEFKLIVFESIANYERNEDLIGWVHGSDVIDPKSTLEEIARLQEENSLLRKQISELETLATYSGFPKLNQPLTDLLNDDAKSLLIAAKNGDGHIFYLGFIGGATIQAGSKNFECQDHREEARWKAALDELVNLSLVESQGYKRENFRLTKRGYDLADEIEAAGYSDCM